MSQFIQALEQRTFLSVTSDTLTTDYAHVVQDAKSVRAALGSEKSGAVSDLAAVRSSVHGSASKDTGRLLVKLTLDDARNAGKVSVAQTILLTRGTVLSLKAQLDGKALLKHPGNAALIAKVKADQTMLDTKIPPLVTAVQTADTNAINAFDADLNAIVTANPGNTALSAAVQTAESDALINSGKYTNATNQFQTDTAILATDVGSLAG